MQCPHYVKGIWKRSFISTVSLPSSLILQKNRPNDYNISTQHITALLALYMQAEAKRSQHLNATYRNIVANDMLRSFDHPFETCCDMLGSVNQTTAHTRALHLCTNMAKWLHHAAKSTNVAWKIWLIWANNTQHVATRRNRAAKRAWHGAPNNVAIIWPELENARFSFSCERETFCFSKRLPRDNHVIYLTEILPPLLILTHIVIKLGALDSALESLDRFGSGMEVETRSLIWLSKFWLFWVLNYFFDFTFVHEENERTNLTIELGESWP